MSEQVFLDEDKLQQKILKGAEILAKNVGATLGPKGRSVILYPKASNVHFAKHEPVVTKDGVTVAKFVHLSDPFENVGAQMIKQAAQKTNTEAGDGTTTSTILAHAILKEASRYILSGTSPVEMKKGMEEAVERIVSILREKSVMISSAEDIEAIATISANNDAVIGKLISNAVMLAGKDGLVTIKDSPDTETLLKTKEGYHLASGWVSNQFMNDARFNRCVFKDPMICVTDERFDTVASLIPILTIATQESRPLILVCEEIESEALAATIFNVVNRGIQVCVIRAPRYAKDRREALRDLATSVGAKFMSVLENRNIGDITLLDFGGCKRAEIDSVKSIFVDGMGTNDEIAGRIDAIKQEMELIDDLKVLEQMQERISKLSSSVVIIEVGAQTELDQKEKKYRIEDALEAVQSAKEEGTIPGGGTALIKCSTMIDLDDDLDKDQNIGISIILRAIREPLRKIVLNAGASDQVVLQNVMSNELWAHGYDAKRDEYGDMMEKGIIDPTKVTICALKNAVSIASTMLMSNHAIIEL